MQLQGSTSRALATSRTRRQSQHSLCQLALLSTAGSRFTCNAQSLLHGYYWVLAEDASVWVPGEPAPSMTASTYGGGLETHAMACNRIGKVPSSHEAVLAGNAKWNQTTATEIASALGLPSPTLGGCCATSVWCTDTACVSHNWGPSSYTNYGFFNPYHRPLYTCIEPDYAQLNDCVQDFSTLCPVGWIAQSNGYVCDAPASYAGPCVTTWVLGLYNDGAKAQWAIQCEASWPETCAAVPTPEVESVTVSDITAGSYILHVEGSGFGDDQDNIAVHVGDSECTDVEICHTVCRPCTTDSECGSGGLCLSVNGIAGSFCSVFCDSVDYSCPCDTQCHEAYGAGGSQPYYFCLNPNVQLVSDLCSEAYSNQMGHSDGSTSVRCMMNTQFCSASQISAHVSASPFVSGWIDATAEVNAASVTDECQTAADCSDGDSCTIDDCSSSSCCEHTYVSNCATSSEGIKQQFPMLNYVLRVGVNLDPRPTSWSGTESPLSGMNDASVEYLPLPFSVPFFDGRVSTLGISGNGIINMGSTFSCDCVGLPTCPFSSCQEEQFFHAVAVYFANLELSYDDTAAVTYNTTSINVDGQTTQVFTVEYTNAPLQGMGLATDRLNASLELHPTGRMVLRYASLPSQWQMMPSGTPLATTVVPRTFVRSRTGLGADSNTALHLDLDSLVEAQSAISLCPVPQVICISPACGQVSGGTVVTVTGFFFDHSCLASGQSPGAGLRCHFGEDIVTATAVASSNGTQISCTSPTVAIAGPKRFQISFGIGLYESEEYLAQNGLVYLAPSLHSVVDTTFTFAETASSCGCSVDSSSLQCDSCGVCGGDNSCIGCDNLHMSGLVIDGCGECGGDNSTCIGCDGILYSNLIVDDCNVCNGSNGDKDCAGVCFGGAIVDNCSVCAGGDTGLTINADMDCAGICNGTSVLDECLVCDSDSSNNCTQDCVGVWGGAAEVDFCELCSGGTSNHAPNSTLDCEGNCAQYTAISVFSGYQYVLAAVLDDCGVCSGGSTGHLANSDKDDCGVCSVPVFDLLGNLTYTHTPNSDKDCTGVCFGTTVVDFCGVCDGGNATLLCDGCDGTITPNNCHQCPVDQGFGFGVIDAANDPCLQDCNFDWGLTADRASIDQCGTCVAGQTGKLAGDDEDCNAVCFGTAVVDECGTCAMGTTNVPLNADMDCAGVCFGTSTLDNCTTCIVTGSGDTSCSQDCAGVWGGTADSDGCQVCSGGTTGLIYGVDVDCYGVCQGTASLDACGICAGGTTSNYPNVDIDCAGICFGNSLVDHCGDCVPLTHACAMDCAGVWGGNASYDACNYCSGGTTNVPANVHMDCRGTCFGPAFVDQCGECACSSHSCTPRVLPNAQRDDCNVCTGTTNKLDARWNKDKDCDGICFGSAFIDDCKQCVDGNTRRVPNADMGCDGVCFSGKTDCGLLHWGPIVLTSTAALTGLLVLICIMMLRARIRQRRMEFDVRIQASTGGVRAAARAEQFRTRTDTILERLPIFEYDTEKHTSQNFSNLTCSICLGDFEDGEELRRLPCHHCFHADCIGSWLGVKHTCPLCVARIVPSGVEEGEP